MTSEDKLIKLYETAVKELYREIAYKDWYGNSTGYQRALLDKVKATLKKLKRKTPGAVREALEQAYATGLTSFCKDTDTAFTPRVNWRQLDIMIQNAVDQLTIATNRVGRIWQDAIRRAGVEATKHKMATGQTVDQMRRQLAVELYHIDPKGKNGKTGIATKRGTMGIVPYAALVARSTTAEAQNAAKINAAGQHGYDLARFTSHAPKCAVCAQYEGRVYALTKEAANGKYKGTSGEPLRFPYLYDTAFASGYNNIHPNCRHRLTIIVPALCTPEQLTEWSRQSMRPFADTRGDRERKAYAAAQAKNRARWQDRRQWEKYRALLPDQTPANFGAFRVMKQSESQRWKDLQADYRYVAKTVKRDIIETGSGEMGTSVLIDKLTPCLVDTKTGEIVDTEYKLVKKSDLKDLKREGWLFDWADENLEQDDIYKLTVKGSNKIQGLIALRYEERSKAVYAHIVESAPSNRGENKSYEGVGGHLFAIAAQRSIEKGYGGFVFLDAKNPELVKHYHERLGAIFLGMPHPYRMVIDERVAAHLLERYTL